MTIKQEHVFRVHKTRTGTKVMWYDGHGLADNIFAKRDTRYFYGEDNEEKAHQYAENKVEELDNARMVPLGERL